MSCSCRRPDILFLPTSWRLVPAVVFVVLTSRVAVLTSQFCRRLGVTILPTSWRLVPPTSWRLVPAIVFVVLTSRVAVLTSRSCRRHRHPGATRCRSDVCAPRLPPFPAVILDVLSSSLFRRPPDVNSSSSRSLSAFHARDDLVVRLAHPCRFTVFIALTIN